MLAWMWKTWVTYTLLVVHRMVQAFWKTIGQFLKILNMHLLYNLAIAFLGI